MTPTKQLVNNTEVLITAMRIIRDAQESVKVTMSAEEEIENPLPKTYFSLLKKKMHSNVRVERIGFGSQKSFDKIRDTVHLAEPNYSFHRTDSADYRRMLLVDDSKLMFRKMDVSGAHVFYSEDPEVIAEYKKYFKRHAL